MRCLVSVFWQWTLDNSPREGGTLCGPRLGVRSPRLRAASAQGPRPRPLRPSLERAKARRRVGAGASDGWRASPPSPGGVPGCWGPGRTQAPICAAHGQRRLIPRRGELELVGWRRRRPWRPSRAPSARGRGPLPRRLCRGGQQRWRRRVAARGKASSADRQPGIHPPPGCLSTRFRDGCQRGRLSIGSRTLREAITRVSKRRSRGVCGARPASGAARGGSNDLGRRYGATGLRGQPRRKQGAQ